MSLYDEGSLQESIEAGARKLAAKRQQRRREQKQFWLLAVFLVVMVPLCVVAGAIASRAPTAPFLIVTWPKPKVRQVLAPGQTLLSRSGQPFTITVSDSENWHVTWSAGGIESGGEEFTWAPLTQKGQLTAHCHPVATGWQKAFTWLWPTRDIPLNTVAAETNSGYDRVVQAGPDGIWVYPHIFAAGAVHYDERALPILASAIPLVPKNELSHQLAGVSGGVTPRLWQLVADFDGHAAAPKEAAPPMGTFASLQSDEIETALPTIAARIVKTSPETSVKFVLRLDKDPKQGVLFLSFNGKRERKAWVRHPGESAGGPWTGWDDEKNGTPVLPSVPKDVR